MTTSASENPGNVNIDRCVFSPQPCSLSHWCTISVPSLLWFCSMYSTHSQMTAQSTKSSSASTSSFVSLCLWWLSFQKCRSFPHSFDPFVLICFLVFLFVTFMQRQDYAQKAKAVLLWGILGFVGVCRIKMWTFALYMCYRNLSRVLVCSSRLSSLSTPCISHGLLWATTPVSLTTRSHVHTSINLFNAVSLLLILIDVWIELLI